MAHKKYTTSSDVWSYGVLLWEIASKGARPYDGMDNLKVVTEVDRGYRMPAPRGCPVALHKLMLRCWEVDRRTRIAFPEVCHVKFIPIAITLYIVLCTYAHF